MRCSLCNSFDSTTIDNGDRLYYHCQTCDFIFLDPKYILSSHNEKKSYLNHNNDINNAGYVKMFEDFFAQIFPYMEAVNKVLDYGCGPGPVMAELLRKKGYEVLLYDIYFYKKEENLNQKYDLIVSTEVFEHLKNPRIVLEQLSKLVKPNGYIAIMTQFHPKDSQKFKTWYYKMDKTHIGFFTKKTFTNLAQKLHLQTLYCNDKNVIVFKVSKV